MKIELGPDQVIEIVVQSLQEFYREQGYLREDPNYGPRARRVRKHIRRVMKYYMTTNGFKEWEKENGH